jgi:hypothetical protein
MVKSLGNTPLTPATQPVRTAAAAPAPAPAKPVKAADTPADGGSKPDPTGGITGKAFDILKQMGGDVNRFRKEHPVLAILIVVAGAFSGWKLDELAHRAAERHDGEVFDHYGQDKYNSLKDQGTDALVTAVKEKQSFIDLGDIGAKKWKAFNTYTVMAEIDNPTLDKDSKPVVLTALAGNKSADHDALVMLAAGIRTRINATPAKQDFYQPVIDALKTNGVTV